MATVKIDGVTFCRNYINRGYCYGLGCKYLHVTRQIESLYKHTGKLPNDIANQWITTQLKLNQRDPNICQDQLQSKCSRSNCKFGTHYVFGTDTDAGNIVEFTSRPSAQMMTYMTDIYQAPTPYWYSDILCHIMTPFPLIAEHIIKVLKPFRIQPQQVSFYYNDNQIPADDSNITPYSLDIGNGVDLFINIDYEQCVSLAEWDCSICLSSSSDVCYCFPCNHTFCINCSLQWFFGISNRNLKLCPLCRADVEQLHFRDEGQITIADHRNLANMADDELSDWVTFNLDRPFARVSQERANIANYVPAGYGGY